MNSTNLLLVRIARIAAGLYSATTTDTDSYDLAERLDAAGFASSIKDTRHGLSVTFRAPKGFRAPAGNLLRLE